MAAAIPVIARKIRRPLEALLKKEALNLQTLYKSFAARIDKRARTLQKAVDEGEDATYTLRYVRALKEGYRVEYQRLQKEIYGWTGEHYETLYQAGQSDGILDLAEAGKLNAIIKPSTGAFHRRALELLADELYTNKNLKATVGRRYDDIFRKFGLQIASGMVSGEDTWRQAMRKELKLFNEYGIDSFTDAAGRKWGLKAYAEMVARTVTMHVMNVGKMNEFLEYGEDLIVVSDFDGACPLCTPWGGRILSISGKTKGYPSYADAEAAGLFHPSCRHSYSLYLVEVWGEPDKDGRVRDANDVNLGRSAGKGDTDGYSSIIEKELFNVNDNNAIEAAFSKLMEENANNIIEKAIVISPDGYRYDIDGTSGTVNVWLTGENALNGAKVIHNHPGSDADSFSKEDFAGFFELGIESLEVAYNGNRHRMTWDKDIPRITKEEAQELYISARRIVEDKAIEIRSRVRHEQYRIMRHLAGTVKGLKFDVLRGFRRRV